MDELTGMEPGTEPTRKNSGGENGDQNRMWDPKNIRCIIFWALAVTAVYTARRGAAVNLNFIIF
eukprot:SAG31_NODE_34164_length_335_cov_13.042373_1_plen_63_part_01